MNTIQWHQECLKNRKRHLNHQKEIIQKLQAEIKRDQEQADFYTFQINSAIKQGKKGFARNRYKVKKGGRDES